MTEPIFNPKILKKVYANQIEILLTGPLNFFSRFDPATPYEKALYFEKSRKLRAEHNQKLARKWTILIESPSEVVKAICELHSPNDYEECSGCDSGLYAESGADWPCKTIELLFNRIENDELKL